MKKLLVLVIICFPLSIIAQQKFTIGRDKSISPKPTNTKYKSITFTIDNEYNGKVIGIFDEGKKNIATLNNKILGDSISKDINGTYTITINDNHKVKECPNDYNVPDAFTIKLDNDFFGPFYLMPVLQTVTVISTQTVNISDDKLGGSILYDAFYIKDNFIKETNTDKIIELLKYYNIKSNNDIESNAFLNSTINNFYTKSPPEGKFSLSSVVSQVGGLDITTIADGFAKFIVKRTKQELSIAFFEKFKDDLDIFPDIQTVFPQTYRTLKAIGDEIYNYEAYIQTLRESFEKDLASLPSNLQEIINKQEDYFNKMPELKAELLTAFYIAQAIQDKQHPGEIIENYQVDILDSVNQNVKASFQTLQLFSKSLRSNNDSTYWAPYSDIKKLAKDTVLLKIYIGLLLQKAKMENEKIVFKDNDKHKLPLDSLMNSSYNNNKNYLTSYSSYIKNFALKTQVLEIKIKGLKKISNDSLLFENYYSMVSSSIDLMRYTVQIEKLPIFKNYNLKLEEKIKPYFDLSQTAADIVIDVNRRNYASAIVNTSQILSKASIQLKELKPKLQNKIKRLTNKEEKAKIKFEKYKNNHKSDTNSYCYNLKKNSLSKKTDKLNEFLKNNQNSTDSIPVNVAQKILKYGSFMAAVAQAKSSDDVEAAIEAVALPSGSARIKRESKFNVSLNAYCGLFTGHESEKFADFNHQIIFNSYGVTAPVGVACSWGIFKHSSFSIFASVIDLGAVTAFRFVDDTTKTLSKIQLKDIISPGLFVSWGIPKSPISVNLGYQLTPILRGVTATENKLQQSLSRFSIGVCVDIPILNITNSSK